MTSRILCAFVWIVVAAGCGGGESEQLAALVVVADRSISGIEVTGSKSTIAVGETLTLRATDSVSGADITDVLRWTSSAPSVATVASGGVVTGSADGSTTLSATIGNLEGSFSLAVSSASLTAIAVGAVNTVVDACDGGRYTATGTYSDGRQDQLTSGVVWLSSDTTIAAFDSRDAGLLLSTQSGTVDVTASLGNVVSDPFPVVISDSLTAVAVVAATTTIDADATEQLSAQGDYNDGSSRDISVNVAWNSATPTVATVDANGLLTGVTAGNTVVSASCNGLSGDKTFTVNQTGSPALVDLDVVGTPPFSVSVGATIKLKVDARFADDSTQDVTEDATWSPSSAIGNAASVSDISGSKGEVTGNFVGSSVIRAVYQSEEVVIQVNVTL